MYCVEADMMQVSKLRGRENRKCNNNIESRPIRGQGHEPLTNQKTDRGPEVQVVPAIDAEVTPRLQCSLECGHWAVRADATSSMQLGGLLTNTVTLCAHEI